MAFPGRPAPFAAVSGAAWETWDLEQVADTGGGARKPGGGGGRAESEVGRGQSQHTGLLWGATSAQSPQGVL